MIIIEPTGGLGNRMRAIDSTVAYGNQVGEKVYVLWIMDKSLNCSFHKLFEKPNGVSSILQLRAETIVGRVIRRLINIGIRSFCDDYYGKSEMDKMMNEGFDFTKFHQSKCMYLQTGLQFHRPEYQFQIFRPIKPLRKIIESYQINKQYVGVHIRRTDHRKSISQSPTALFIEKMQEEVEKNPSTKFFVSSDSVDEKKILLTRFPERIVLHEQSNFNRNDASAVQNAVIDLYLLSNCRKIIGSYRSSFTYTACKLNGAEKEIIHAE